MSETIEQSEFQKIFRDRYLPLAYRTLSGAFIFATIGLYAAAFFETTEFVYQLGIDPVGLGTFFFLIAVEAAFFAFLVFLFLPRKRFNYATAIALVAFVIFFLYPRY
jgi:hypothetical protein